MTNLPLLRLIAAVVFVTFVGSAFGFVMCRTESLAAMWAQTAACAGLGLLFLVKWWILAVRNSHGTPVAPAERPATI